jgi:Zierdtviridae exonuclease
LADPPIITTSERKSFTTCPQQWWWSFRCGLTSKQETPDALWFGIGVHIALAEWYGYGFERGPLPVDTFRAWVGDEIRFIKASYSDREREWYDEQLYLDAKELGTEMLTGYVARYGKDPDWEVLAIEQPFELEIVEDDEVIAIFTSTFDGVYRDHSDGMLKLMEHKTAAQIALAYLALDNQAGSYFAAATLVLRHLGILKEDEDIEGIQYNFLRKAKPDPRPRNAGGAYLNQDGSVSKKQPPDNFVRPDPIERSPREVGSQIARIADEVGVMNKIRTGELPILKNTGIHCVRCPFFMMCTLHEKGGAAWMEFRDAEFAKRDPYARYRGEKSAAE